ncbi:MAG TPA: carbohydrate-binding protein, partial [Gemmataceae bacterium]
VVNGGDGNDLADVDALDFITADTEERTGVQAPYFGGPWFLPTTIEAENFDFGGQDVAYHDNDVNLASAGTRGRTFVDVGTALILTRPPASVTYVSANAGEWIEYTVDVPADGGYQIQTSVSSSGAPGGTFHYELDGVAKTPSLSVPNTGLLIAFRNVTWGGINLPAGRHILRLSFDTDSATTGQVGLFNAINLVYEPRQPYNGAAAPIPGTVEAEQFDTGGEGVAFHELTLANEGGQYRNTAVDIEASSDTGGGFDLGFTKAGEWVEYDVNVARTGIYVLSARVASDGLGGIFRILFGGVDRTGGVKVPNTGGWQTWQTVTRGVKLTKGEQVMRLNLEPGGATGWVGNFNWIRIAPLDGDANLDGKVNFADYQALELAYGKAVDPWAPGDFDGDGASGNNDVRLLLANYGASITPAVPADPVPEPAATARSPSAMPPEPVVLPPHPRKPVARTPRPV